MNPDRSKPKTTFIKFIAVVVFVKLVHLFGLYLLSPGLILDNRPDLKSFANPALRWDSGWYLGIVDNGYVFHPSAPSSVAFFPGYPALAAGFKWTFGLESGDSLLLVAHVASVLAMAACFLVFRILNERTAFAALLLMGLFPGNIGISLGYSEALFLLLLALTILCGLKKQHVLAAVCAGLLTSVKAIGMIGPVIFLFALMSDRDLPVRLKLRALLIGLPLSLSGIALFSIYLWISFDEPFAFAIAESAWNPSIVGPQREWIKTLLMFPYLKELFRALFLYSDPPNNVKIAVLLFPVFLALGVNKLPRRPRWLVAVAVIFLLIPYFASDGKDYRSFMRYIGVSVPHFWLLSEILERHRRVLYLMLVLFAVVSSMLCAEFANWYWVF